MGRSKVRLRNNLQEQVRLQEGNAGVYSTRVVLPVKGFYDLDIDPNATYREYIMITSPGDSKLEALSSDDIANFAEIVVEKDEATGLVRWRGVESEGFGMFNFFRNLISRRM